MKRISLVLVFAVAMFVGFVPNQSQACEHSGHRLRALIRVPLRVAAAPVRIVRKLRERCCCCCCGSDQTVHEHQSVIQTSTTGNCLGEDCVSQ